jgi:hypothetical protein|tara:strand:+ start:252 stop:1022 length:771 start_codon:yes stop_codon:yes gene_type:complete
MSFIAAHRRNILNRKSIQYSQIKPGNILTFRYRNKEGIAGLEYVLALNVYPMRGGRKDKKLHALVLENMSIPIFNRIINRIYSEYGNDGAEYTFNKDDIESSLQIETFRVEGGEDGDKFYYRNIKRFDRYDLYRTYKLDALAGVKLITYDFSKFDMRKKLVISEQKALPKQEPISEKLQKEIKRTSKLDDKDAQLKTQRLIEKRNEKVLKQNIENDFKQGDLGKLTQDVSKLNPNIPQEQLESMIAQELESEGIDF